MENGLKYVIKRGTQLLWLYSGMVAFFACSIMAVISRMFEIGIVGSMMFFIPTIIFFIFGMLNRFGFNNECLKIYEDSIIHTKNEVETKYFWNEILYKKEKIHYVVYRHTHGIKTQYSFYKDEKLLFIIDDRNYFDALKFIEEKLINTGILKEQKTIIDGEEVLEIKARKTMSIDLIVTIVISVFIAILTGGIAFIDVEGHTILFIMYIISLPFQIKYFKREYQQFKQEIHVVKDKGIYILTEEKKINYSFNEIDNIEVKYCALLSNIESVVTLYVNNEPILVLTNSNTGFYEFLDILKEKNIYKV